MRKLKLCSTDDGLKPYSNISVSKAVFIMIFKHYICKNLHVLLLEVEIEAVYIKASLLS